VVHSSNHVGDNGSSDAPKDKKKGGIISKIRRRLTVQGDSETLDGGAMAELSRGAGRPKPSDQTEDVRSDIDGVNFSSLCKLV